MDEALKNVGQFFLLQGAFEKLSVLFCFGYCVAAAQTARAANKKANNFKGAALTSMNAWGGQIIVALILGGSSPLLKNEGALMMPLIAWYLTGLSEPMNMLSSLPGKIFLSISSNIMRAHIMIQCYDQGVAASTAPDWYNVSVAVPMMCGILGGVGACFLPFSKGVDALDGWPNWSSRSAVVFNLVRQLMRDGNVGPRVAALASPLKDGDFINMTVVAFLVVAPLIVSVMPDLPNPLGVEAAFNFEAAKPTAAPVDIDAPRSRRSASPKRK